MDQSRDYHAALYIRLSKEDEGEGPSESVTNQQSLLERFAEDHHLSVFGTYIDDGWSGTDFQRPGFQRMLRDIENGNVNLIITKDLSRLGRDYIMTGYYMERYFPEKRVRYVSLLDGIDTGVESSVNDMTPFRAIVNDMYAKDISQKIKSVKRDKQRKGQFIGGKPAYGYRMHPTEKNKIIIDEHAAQIVRKIFYLALEGMSCRSIAETLNQDHVPSPAVYCGWYKERTAPYGGLWYGERISEMLKNEVYIGNMVQGRMQKVSYKSRKCIRQKQENWIIVEGTHTPIVTKEVFQKVQKLLNSRRNIRSRTYEYILKGLIFCHECGYPLGVINRPPRSGEPRLYFICRTYQRSTKAGICTSHTIRECIVTEAVVMRIRELCEPHLNYERLYDIAFRMLEKHRISRSKEAALQTLHEQLKQTSDLIERVYLDYRNSLLLEMDFLRIYENLKENRKNLIERVRALEREQECGNSTEDVVKDLIDGFVSTYYKRRECLINLIKRTELTREKQILIKVRFRKPEV